MIDLSNPTLLIRIKVDKNLSVYDIKIKKLIEEASENPFELKKFTRTG